MVEGKCNAVKKNMGSYFENSAGLFYRAPASAPNAKFYANQPRSCTWSGCDAKTHTFVRNIAFMSLHMMLSATFEAPKLHRKQRVQRIISSV